MKTFTFRTSDDVMAKLKYIAEFNGRSANKELEQYALAVIRQFESDHGKITQPCSKCE